MSNEIAYFDNAATTFPKPASVYSFADDFYRSSGGNIGRGGNALALRAGEIAKCAKANLLKLYACESKTVAFTASATDALNRVLLGLGLRSGDRVCITPFEHNAVTRPLHHLRESDGIQVDVMTFDPHTLLPDIEGVIEDFDLHPPRVVVLNHASNVFGAVVPVMDLAEIAKRYGAITVVDMSQTAGLVDLEIASELIDFAVFAGHKSLLAPFGIGGLICDRGATLDPVLFGGNGVDSVDQDMPKSIVPMIEVGSQNTYAIAGLKASTEWILENGMVSLRERETASANRLLRLLSRHDGIRIHGSQMRCDRIGVISATFDGFSPDEVEMLLGRYGVAVRSGIQCAPLAHRFMGTLPVGTVRFSVSALTDDAAFERLELALDEICDC